MKYVPETVEKILQAKDSVPVPAPVDPDEFLAWLNEDESSPPAHTEGHGNG